MKLDLNDTKALWVLGLIPSETLPQLATDALVQGYDSESLVELAGQSGEDVEKARRLFARSLEELSPSTMRTEDALRQYARMVALLILASTISPLDGARQIWSAMRSARMSDFHDLDAFVYAASELEDRPEDRELFENAILTEARRWSRFEMPESHQ